MTTDIKKNKLTPKQERFALNLFKGLSQRESYIQAGYSSNTQIAGLDVHASNLANSAKVLLRLRELQEEAKDETIGDVRERQQRLTVFMREDIVNKEGEFVRTSNIQATSELNKMTHIYDEKPQYQDNRTYNILVQGDEARDRFGKLLEGKRPQEIEEVKDDKP